MSSIREITVGTTARQEGNKPRGKRSEAVFGIRGLAALALLTVHVAMFSGLFGTRALGEPRPPSNFAGAFLVSGFPSFIGVFFVLPALFLYLPIAKAIIAGERRPPLVGNLARRLIRLLPAYYAMYLVVLVALNRDAITGVWYVLRPILLLQVYLPTPFRPNLMNGMEITWTVPSMVQWYLALPLIAAATHRFAARGTTPAARARRLMLPVPILIAGGLGWLFLVKAQGLDNRMVFWWPQGFAPTIGIGMALAILIALAQVSPKDTSRLLRTAAVRPNLFWAGAVLVYLVNCARPFSVIGMDAIYSVSGLLVTYLMVALFGLLTALPLVTPGARPHLCQAILAKAPVAYLGRISYGIYLWHFAVMHFYLQPRAVLDGHARPIRELYGICGFVQLESVTIAGAVVLASISYFLIERPVSAWADRRFRGDGRRAQVAGPPSYRPVPMEPSDAGSPLDRIIAVLAAASTDRDAIRSNLMDLEQSYAVRLLGDASLTGQSRSRWEAATADIAAAWELFNAYSTAVDDATQVLNGSRHPDAHALSTVADILEGSSILISGAPAPLAERHITDNGRRYLTSAAAVEEMNQLFRRVAELLTTVEDIWNDATRRLDTIRAGLSEVDAVAQAGDAALVAALAAANAELDRFLDKLTKDPISLWRRDRSDFTELDALGETLATLIARARRSTPS
jgi:peptidoglycan/LPS O-acetylase OafA/YrhL